MHDFIDIMLLIFGIVIIFFFSLLIVIKTNKLKKGKIIEVICFLDNKGTHNIVAHLSRHKDELFIMNLMIHADHSA